MTYFGLDIIRYINIAIAANFVGFRNASCAPNALNAAAGPVLIQNNIKLWRDWTLTVIREETHANLVTLKTYYPTKGYGVSRCTDGAISLVNPRHCSSDGAALVHIRQLAVNSTINGM